MMSQVDLSFASFSKNRIPSDLKAITDGDKDKMDGTCARSLNGTLNADVIRETVGGNFESFQLALRAVKVWAKSEFFVTVWLKLVVCKCVRLFSKVC